MRACGRSREQIQRGDGNIVERTEACAMRAPGVVTAAGGVARDAMCQRQPRSQQRAAGGTAGAARYQRRDRKSDLALDLLRHAAGDHLINIVCVVRSLQRRFRSVVRLDMDGTAKQAGCRQMLRQRTVLSHRKAVVRREMCVVVGVADDVQVHATGRS